MTCRLSSLNFLRLWQIGQTFGSMVRRWHRKSGSMLAMSEVDHVKASMCRAMTSTIWSCASWPKDLPSLNFLPLISLFKTSSTGSGRCSQAISRRVTPSSLGGWVVTEHNPLFVLRLFSKEPFGLLLMRLHGDHGSFKGRQFHLHMP